MYIYNRRTASGAQVCRTGKSPFSVLWYPPLPFWPIEGWALVAPECSPAPFDVLGPHNQGKETQSRKYMLKTSRDVIFLETKNPAGRSLHTTNM